jgi:lipopolysaccharide/colanic/teichoic acid biosynthesis glycosyltransferase
MYQRLIKPQFDLLLLFLTAPIWLLLMGIVIVMIYLRDGAPLFYTEQRLGRNRLPFEIYKFRSLKKAQPGLLIKDHHCPELTKNGGWLRHSGLDELPQFLNILKGEMSLVGPRPVPINHSIIENPQANARFQAKPGITGLAQIKGRNKLSWQERLCYDQQYCSNISFLKDGKILLITPFALLNFGADWTNN